MIIRSKLPLYTVKVNLHDLVTNYERITHHSSSDKHSTNNPSRTFINVSCASPVLPTIETKILSSLSGQKNTGCYLFLIHQ
jgi:hypothetical protein